MSASLPNKNFQPENTVNENKSLKNIPAAEFRIQISYLFKQKVFSEKTIKASGAKCTKVQ